MPTRCPRCHEASITYEYRVPVFVAQGADMKVSAVHVVDEGPEFTGRALCGGCGHSFETRDEPADDWPAWEFG